MQNKIKAALFLLLAVMGFKSLPAEAAVDIFLCSNDSGLKGETEDSNNKDCIDILAWSWGVSNSGDPVNGGGSGGSGRANFQALSITKWVDRSSDQTLAAVTEGTAFQDAELKVFRAGGCSTSCGDPYISIKMDGVFVSSQSMGGSGGEDRLTENITLIFREVEYCYAEQKLDGSSDVAQCFGWNIVANEVKQ